MYILHYSATEQPASRHALTQVSVSLTYLHTYIHTGRCMYIYTHSVLNPWGQKKHLWGHQPKQNSTQVHSSRELRSSRAEWRIPLPSFMHSIECPDKETPKLKTPYLRTSIRTHTRVDTESDEKFGPKKSARPELADILVPLFVEKAPDEVGPACADRHDEIKPCLLALSINMCEQFSPSFPLITTIPPPPSPLFS
jgi:hypothetical protein